MPPVLFLPGPRPTHSPRRRRQGRLVAHRRPPPQRRGQLHPGLAAPGRRHRRLPRRSRYAERATAIVLGPRVLLGPRSSSLTLLRSTPSFTPHAPPAPPVPPAPPLDRPSFARRRPPPRRGPPHQLGRRPRPLTGHGGDPALPCCHRGPRRRCPRPSAGRRRPQPGPGQRRDAAVRGGPGGAR